jgi:hypothetical protein
MTTSYGGGLKRLPHVTETSTSDVVRRFTPTRDQSLPISHQLWLATDASTPLVHLPIVVRLGILIGLDGFVVAPHVGL